MKTFLAVCLGLAVAVMPSEASGGCISFKGPATASASGFQGVTIGSKLKTTPVKFDRKVGLPGGGSLAPGLYDLEVASMGEKSRVMLLFFQKGRKMGETPGVLKLMQGALGGIPPCTNPRGGVGPSCKTGGVAKTCVDEFCIAMKSQQKGAGQAPPKRYLSFDQLGFKGGVVPSVRPGAAGGLALTIPGGPGSSIEASLPAAK